MMPTSTRAYDMVLSGEAWRDMRKVLEERKTKITEDLSSINNTRERDIELKARLQEISFFLALPEITRNMITLSKEIEDARETMGRSDDNGSTAEYAELERVFSLDAEQ